MGAGGNGAESQKKQGQSIQETNHDDPCVGMMWAEKLVQRM